MIRLAGAVLVLAALSTGALPAQSRSGEIYVGRVRFKGNKSLDAVTLGASIATSSSSWIYRSFHRIGDRNTFDETEFRRDVVRLQLLYRQHGFYEAKIDTTVDRRDRLVDPTFIIVEGPPIVVDSISITGIDSIPDASSMMGRLTLKKDGVFDRFLFDDSGDSIAFAVRDRGFPYAIVFRNFTVNRLTRHSTVQYDVLTGPHAVIADIAIAGNQRITERTLRRALTIRNGDEYRATALFNSQRSLYQTELFQYANVAIAAPDSTVGGVDSLVRVRVNVAEANPLRARAGVGYGTVDCLRASGTLTALNFIGEARRLDLVTRVSKIGAVEPLNFGLRNSLCKQLENDRYSTRVNYLASATLSQPIGLVRGAVFSIQAFKERRSEFNVYLLTTVGGAMSLRFGIGRSRGIPVTLRYRLSNDQITADTAQYCIYFNQCDPTNINEFASARRQGTLSASLVNQRVDSPVEPTKGQILTLELTTASKLLGSEVVFDRVVAEGVIYRPVGRRRVLSGRLRAGIIREGLSRIGGADQHYLPPSEAFYAGGPTTVRGFGRNEMGPVVYVYERKDTTKRDDDSLVGLRSSALPSSAIVLANIELRTPTPLLGGRLGMSFFIDGGQLWSFDGSRYVAGGFKITPGIGFQISTPLGPMRLTAAYNGYGTQPGALYLINGATLTREPVDYGGRGKGGGFFSHLQWQFSVGNAF